MPCGGPERQFPSLMFPGSGRDSCARRKLDSFRAGCRDYRSTCPPRVSSVSPASISRGWPTAGSRCRRDSDFVVHCPGDPLRTAEVTRGGLDGDAARQKRDPLQFASGRPTSAGASSANAGRREHPREKCIWQRRRAAGTITNRHALRRHLSGNREGNFYSCEGHIRE